MRQMRRRLGPRKPDVYRLSRSSHAECLMREPRRWVSAAGDGGSYSAEITSKDHGWHFTKRVGLPEDVAQMAEEIVNHKLPGKLFRAGMFARN